MFSHTIATDYQYRFRPLRISTTIRLIRICPEKINDHIACRIYHVDEERQETIKYHALSYVWGNSERPKYIYLRDQGKWYRFQLHESLWQFLDNAWQRGMFDQYYWTDYLCIDQSAHTERSHQVQRMHIIYRNAALVITWLQLREQEERGLLEFIDTADRISTGKIRWFSWIELLAQYDLRQVALKVITNPYWGRIWIVQEVVVAKEVCVYTKRISISLNRLNDILRWTRMTVPRGGPSIEALCDMRATGGKIPLWRILKDFKDYQSKYEVDRIYGIFGLAENNEDGSSPATNIPVDYERKLSHVMLDVLFESSPPLNHVKEIILIVCSMRRHLDPDGLGPGIVAWMTIKTYIDNSKTTERHRDCARIALRALEAFHTMLTVAGTLPPNGMELLANLISSAAEADWRATSHQNAALVGMMLSGEPGHGSPGRLRLTAHRSAWRCAAHGSRDAYHMGLGSYETAAAVATPPGAWSCSGIVGACGKQSRDCDGSSMTHELPHVGLRIQVEPAIDSGDEGRLSLHRMKFEA